MDIYGVYTDPDDLRNIALTLSIDDLINLCYSNKVWRHYTCGNEDFWLSRLRLDYPDLDLSRKRPDVSYQDLYIRLYRNIGWWIQYTVRDPPLERIQNVALIEVSQSNIYMVDRAGRLWGKGSIIDRKIPDLSDFVQIPLPPNVHVRQMSSYRNTLFILDTDGIIWGYGVNTGNLIHHTRYHDRFTNFVASPAQPSDIISVKCGGFFLLVLRGDGTVWGKGENRRGVLGPRRQRYGVGEYRPIGGIDSRVVKMSCGSNHAMFIDLHGRLWGIGSNFYGQLGIGDYVDRDRPVMLSENIRDVSCGPFCTVVLDNHGDAYVAGRISADISTSPSFTPIFQGATDISTGTIKINLVDRQHRIHRIGPDSITPIHMEGLYCDRVDSGYTIMAFYGAPTDRLGLLG